jgi:phosphoribosylformylglycinamidine cyclo-ligase
MLKKESGSYAHGTPIKLPFSTVFPIMESGGDWFYDLQVEGVGTKTLLAELSGNYSTIGIDAVAMVVNDVIRSGAEPLLISDAIHAAESRPAWIDEVLGGVRRGARLASCTLASGETGDVPEILHARLSGRGPSIPFDLIASCFGRASKGSLIMGNLSVGDRVIGIESSGIHSNGLTLARKVLLKKWGGLYDPWDEPSEIGKPVIDELMEPTRIYAKALASGASVASGVSAALHITGDSFGKFQRLIDWSSGRGKDVGFDFRLQKRTPGVFQLIYDSARALGRKISMTEMFRTFNMGYGFALVVKKSDSHDVLDALNRHFPSDEIGSVSTSRRIEIHHPSLEEKALII